MNEKNNQKNNRGSGTISPARPTKEELHRQMQRSLSSSSSLKKAASSTSKKSSSSNKSVSQLSEKQSSKKRVSGKNNAGVSSGMAEDKIEKMRRIKESMNSIDEPVLKSKKSSAPSSTAAEAQRYVQRQASSTKRRRDVSETYDYEIPKDYRQSKRIHDAQAAVERKSKTGIIAAFAVLIILVLVYFIGVIISSGGFLHNTYMNGVNISGMTMSEAEDAVIHKVEVKGLTFVKKNGDEVHFKGEEFGSTITMENEDSFIEAASQNPFLWFVNLFSKKEYSTKLINTYDEGKLADIIRDYTWGSAPPTDAYLQRQSDGMYTIIPEDNGDMIDADILVTHALEMVRGGETVINLKECDCYLYAKVTQASLKKACEEANALQGLTITYDFGDRTEVLESSTIVEWVSSDTEGNIIVDENAVEAWVQANIADKYDTFKAGYTRTFNSTIQGTVQVPLGEQGIYGWLTDVGATAEQLIGHIRDGKSVTVEPAYKQKGYSRNTDDIGNTYIEVDITNQHVWYYKDGELVMDTDCVTGTATDPERATPTGVFQVWSMERDIDLVGADYSTPVAYWMNISYCGVGLHDLSRDAYGGDIYQYNGSHGCINLPPEFAENLFNAIDTGMPVLIIP